VLNELTPAPEVLLEKRFDRPVERATMHGFRSARFLGGMVLLALFTFLAVDPPAAFGQKKKKRKTDAPAQVVQSDASKRPAPVVAASLPARQKLTAEQLARHIDRAILARLKEEKVEPSPRCSDEEFVRRAYLDITGKVPTGEQAARFLDSKESSKRGKLIDELLASKDYGRHMADVWQALLLPRNSDNRRLQQYYPHLVKWLDEKFNANTGWDQMVKEVLTASGAVEKNGPVIYWLANPTADKVTDNVSKLFLGVQLQCAQCHNHPFTDWKQTEYWGMAAFFLKVRPNGNPRAAARTGATISISEQGGGPRGKQRMLPESAKILPPKFLQGDKPSLRPSEPARPALAAWMTSPRNPFFARAMVNRVWYQFLGRGFVNPVDDMHEGNAVSHPKLLADLAQQFAGNGFDVKYLVRAVCNSDAYQRSSKPLGNNLDAGPELFARMAIRPLTPEQMFDSLTQLMGAPGRGAGPRAKGMAGRFAPNGREQFVNFFSAEEGADPTEYHTGIPQVLRLMNAPQLNNAAALMPILRTSKSPADSVEKLYLAVLARLPRTEEIDRVNQFLQKNKDDRRQAFAGLLWALMNSSEFALNR
jgi:hypothetical protein